MKKTIHITILSILLITISLYSSAQKSSNFYKHMEGVVGENIYIIAELNRIDNSLSGYYYYYFDETEGEENWVHFGKSMPVSGTIDNDNNVKFSEFGSDISGATFKGKFTGKAITGVWTSSDGKKTLPFELIEIYPKGTAAFTVYHLQSESKLVDKKDSPIAKQDLTLLLPAASNDATVADSVKSIILKNFFSFKEAQADPDKMLQTEGDLYFNNYKNSNADIYKDNAASFNWEKNKSVKVQYNQNYILSIECYDYGYTGGAHGLSVSRFSVVDLHDGHLFSLDDIFRPDYLNDLRDIINTQLRSKYKLQKDQSMKDAGFFYDFVEPSTNFYVNKDGIGFYYNQYEVAPFAMGPIDIFVPFRFLKRILKENSPLLPLLGND